MSVHLQGLAAGTTYHYRVVAVSEPGGEPVTTKAPTRPSRRRPPAAKSRSPTGGRGKWSPRRTSRARGSSRSASNRGTDIQAAADGNGITYTATAPFVANPAGSRAGSDAGHVHRERPAAGRPRTSRRRTTKGPTTLRSATDEYKLFSTDLSLGLVEPAGDTPLPPLPASAEKTVYLRKREGAYKALVTAANVPPGTKFGDSGEGGGLVHFVAGLARSQPCRVSTRQLTLDVDASTGAKARCSTSGRKGSCSPPACCQAGNHTAAARRRGTPYGTDRQSTRSPTDGSRVIWEPWIASGHLYLRDMARKETVAVDAAQGAPEPEAGSVHVQDRQQGRFAGVLHEQRAPDASSTAGEAEARRSLRVRSDEWQRANRWRAS